MMNEKVVVSKLKNDLLVPINVDLVEQKYNATFVCETCIRDKHGNWSQMPVQIYWQENPPKGYSNYFAVFTQQDDQGKARVYITNGQTAVEDPITAIRHNDQIVFSRYRHDFRCIGPVGDVAIDGGRDYTKIVGNPQEMLTLHFDGPNLVIKEIVRTA